MLPPPGASASRSASICSSCSSLSLRPSAPKNLTPLYSGGLCDAVITTPRSRRSSATAGVGTTPASTAEPPADETPRTNASSSSSPDPRVSRPTKTREPAPAQSAAALPRRSTRSTVRNSPTIPRTPSVPKYARTGRDPSPRKPRCDCSRALALRELRRLARLVQAGLLALDLTGVAREEALALERDAQLGIRLDECARDAVADCAGLAGQPTAVHPDAQVVLTLDPGDLQRRRDDRAPDRAREVVLDRLPVHPCGAVARPQDDACDRGLALAGAAVLSDLTQITAPGSTVAGSAARADARSRRRSSTCSTASRRAGSWGASP